MQSAGLTSLNHDIMALYSLRLTPMPPKKNETPTKQGLCIVCGYGPTPNRSHINAIHMQGG